tara:strand:- start:658 stop:1227 length:570 start_codon:yes stop_codon:yes gene_type:complete
MKLTKKQLKQIVKEELLTEGILDRLRAQWKGEVAAASAGPIARVFKGMKSLMGGDPKSAAAAAKLDPDEKRAVARMKSIIETFYESISDANNDFYEDIKKLGVSVEGTRAAELSPILDNARDEIQTRSYEFIQSLNELMRAVGLDVRPWQDVLDAENAGEEEKTEVDLGTPSAPTGMEMEQETEEETYA